MTAAAKGPEALHLVKLCVGADTVEDLRDWQAGRSAAQAAAGLDPLPRHVTRMWPRRERELLHGGSLYWVIKGVIAVRQRLRALEEEHGPDGLRRCALVLDPALIRTEPVPRKPFQGWRYLAGRDAPPDLSAAPARESALPASLSGELEALGVLRR